LLMRLDMYLYTMKIPKDLLVNIGKNIRFYRTRKGLSQKELADTIGVAPTQFNRLELGATNVSILTLVKVSKALGISLDVIVFGDKQDSNKGRALVEKAQLLEDHVGEEDKKLASHFFDLLIAKNRFKQIVTDLEIR
jgi:transcriptional regulator with XRE-family HTH domain